jgi:probable O-glycosylation ligase (exosortase A-associated)
VSLRAILLLVALIPCVPICFFRPFFGVLAWTVISFANPQRYAWGSAYYFPSAELIAIPTILGFVFFSNGWTRIISRESLLIVLLWAWFTITSIVASSTPLLDAHSTDTWFRYQFVSKILLMVFLTMGIVDSFARLRTLIMVTAGCFTFYVVKALPWMIMTAGSFRLYGPPRSMVEDNNDLALALNMTLPMLFFLAHTESDRRLKRLFWFLFVAVIFGVLCTYSRGGLVGLVAVLTLMILQLRQRMLLAPVMLLAITVVALFAPEQWSDRMNLTNKEATLDKSAYSRINAWTFSWRLAQDYPITGGGFETFQKVLFDRYAPNPQDVHGPHSIYFGVLAEHGFVGLALYLTLIASSLASTWRIRRIARRVGDDTAAGYAYMLQFSLIAFLVSGMFLGRAYFDYFFTIVCFIVILKRECFAAWRNMDAADPSGAEAAA